DSAPIRGSCSFVDPEMLSTFRQTLPTLMLLVGGDLDDVLFPLGRLGQGLTTVGALESCAHSYITEVSVLRLHARNATTFENKVSLSTILLHATSSTGLQPAPWQWPPCHHHRHS